MKDSACIQLEGIPEIVPVHRPVAQRLFLVRSARFRSLAPKHAIGEYLAAMAHVADGQHLAATRACINVEERFLEDGFHLRATDFQRDECWRGFLGLIRTEMKQVSLPSPARAALGRLSSSPPEKLESTADSIIKGEYDALDLAAAPFVSAALQVYWTILAGMLHAKNRAESRLLCPACASSPVAGIVLGNQKLRYLVCGLCATEWYLPRLTCAGCGSTAGLSYFVLEGDTSGVKAEACAQCRTYLKVFYQESAPGVEPFVDDIATLALDLLMSEEGYSRIASNLFLLPGAAQ